ncbi:MAG TPA: glycosyltransferase family 4 protein [Polyangiales bacterium]|jgi:glycosyltransferase involved in cell wall biosynthesis|nr:glycosyltransferase family 4 protein [Polyangiales bacterium]
MRIALIDPSLFTWPYDSALALALRDAGHTVRIFGKQPRAADTGPALELLEPHFYRELEPLVGRVPHPLFLGLKGLSHSVHMARLLRELRAFHPDVIHFQWAPLPAVDRLFLPALRRIAKTVLTVHDSAPFNGNPRSKLQAAGAISIMSSFDRLIVHTEAAAERLRSYGIAADRVCRIAHGPLEGSTLPVKRAAVGGDQVTVLLFGRIKHYKGTDVLLRAAGAMRKDLLARTRIRVVGQPFIDLAPLHELAASVGVTGNVSIEPRFVSDQEVAELLGAADIVALPYREIDASGVLMTALSAGVPIIATRVGLFAELLQDGMHGRLVDVEDHTALARALEALVESSELRARMGEQVRALRDALPTWGSIAQETTQLYEKLVPTAGHAKVADPLYVHGGP